MTSDAIEQYLVDNLDVHHRAGDELVLRECLVCNRAQKMYVNVVKAKFNCYSSHCEARGNLVGLIRLIEETDLIGAVQKLKELTAGTLRARPSSELKQLLDKALAGAIEEHQEPSIQIPLPAEFIPCYDGKRTPKWRIPPYLRAPKPGGRQLDKDDIQRWGIGYAPRGTYGGRIVVPVECDGMSSFVARGIESSAFPKYLNPGAGLQSTVLFGYDQVVPRQPLVAVEGVFHAIRMWSYGHQAVAYFGSYISEPQARLIARLEPSRITWIPDTDAVNKAVKQVPRILPITGPIQLGRIGAMGFSGDCDDATAEHIEYVMETAKELTATLDALDLQLRALKNPWE